MAIWIVLPILTLLMFDLGLTLKFEDFGKVFRSPWPIVIALVGQLILLPLIALGLAWAFKLPPVFFIGLVLIACCPGGSSSNVFSKLAGGDVALSVTLTALSSVTVEVLQFIKHSESHPPHKKINSNDTIIDTKFYIKKYFNKKNSDKILSNSFSKLVPYEEENQKKLSDKDEIKLIKFYKIPQKNLDEEDEFLFEEDAKEKNKKETNNTKPVINQRIKINEIKTLKYNKKAKLFFNINYRNVYDCINELYLPLMQNIESISSFKSNTENTIKCLEFLCSHNSIFELLNSNEEKNNTNNIISEIMTELKIFEIIDLCMILFILHIILEAKI